MQRAHDAKVRLAPTICLERIGWRPRLIGRLLVLVESTANRERLRRNAALIDATLPARARAIDRWLREPSGPIAGVWTLRLTHATGGKRQGGAPTRVRSPASVLREGAARGEPT